MGQCKGEVCGTCEHCKPYHNSGHICICNFKFVVLSGTCKDWEETNVEERIANRSW